MIIPLVLCVLALVVMFKVTGFFLRLCGKLLGVIFSLAGYALIGTLVIGSIGLGIIVIPLIAIAGLFSIISNITKLF